MLLSKRVPKQKISGFLKNFSWQQKKTLPEYSYWAETKQKTNTMNKHYLSTN
jgi:hypothetical protein